MLYRTPPYLLTAKSGDQVGFQQLGNLKGLHTGREKGSFLPIVVICRDSTYFVYILIAIRGFSALRFIFMLFIVKRYFLRQDNLRSAAKRRHKLKIRLFAVYNNILAVRGYKNGSYRVGKALDYACGNRVLNICLYQTAQVTSTVFF